MYKRMCVIGIFLLSGIGCSQSNTVADATAFETYEQAQTAINAETKKIGELIQLSATTQSETEKKQVMCELLPQHYDHLASLIDANLHHMQDEDQKILPKMKELMAKQKQEFLNSRYC